MDWRKKLSVSSERRIAFRFTRGGVVSFFLILSLAATSSYYSRRLPRFNTLSFQNLELNRDGYRNSGKDANSVVQPGRNGSSIVEKLSSWNSAIKDSQAVSPSLYNRTSISSNGTTELGSIKGNLTFSNNLGEALLDANSTKENILLENPHRNDDFLDEMKDGSLQNQHCDIFDGKWVSDEASGPLYPPGSCPYIDDAFSCFNNGRPDHEFLKWRWQPNHCDIPRLNATDFLERLRGKRLLFVGDSLNRNMWESLVCILRHGVSNKSRVAEALGQNYFKKKSPYSFRFKDYNCHVDFVRSTFLVKKVSTKTNNGLKDVKLRLDLLDEIAGPYNNADVIVFNTGHWWTHDKTSKRINYYQEGNNVYPVLEVQKAYKKALTTWARWVDANINPEKTRVVFRGFSMSHFRGGQWNSGGQCHKETEPIFNESFLSRHPSKVRALEQILRQMKTPVIYLNVSRLTDYRKDGHPSIYRKRYSTLEEQTAAARSQDCSHWCLPGVPDSWNELLYASLLQDGKGSWRNQFFI